MQAAGELISPHGSPTKLVQVTTLGHEDVAGAERSAIRHLSGNGYLSHRIEIEISSLNVRHTQVRPGYDLTAQITLTVHREPVLQWTVSCGGGQHPGQQRLGHHRIGSLFENGTLSLPTLRKGVDASSLSVEKIRDSALVL